MADVDDQEGQEEGQEAADGSHGTSGTTEGTEAQNGSDEPETFPREYVERLRREAAGYRDRARDRDALAERLHVVLVQQTGRLADPTDLPYDAAHLDDEGALTAAVDELLARKPHLTSRRPSGDVGQGATGTSEDVDLAGMLRGLAG